MIAVLIGGNSAEREVSLKSGNAIYQALRNQNIDCFKFDWFGDNLDKLWQQKFDKVFIALHGRGGEDGFIQKKLEDRNIPYTGSNQTASENCMDKVKTKQIWQKHNLPLAQSIVANINKSIKNINFPLPWAVKPTLEGSSIGISKVVKKSQLQDALKLAYKYDENALIERWIEGDEYTVAILNNKPLPVIKIISHNTFYDYKSKYTSDDTEYFYSCGLTKKAEKQLQKIALQAFDVIKASNWGRVDFIVDKDNNPCLLEINTVPGMTAHSLVPKAAKAAGISFDQLVKKIIDGKN